MDEREYTPAPKLTPKPTATQSFNPRCADCIFAERDAAVAGLPEEARMLRCHAAPPTVIVIPGAPPAQRVQVGRAPEVQTQMQAMFTPVLPEWWCAHFDDGSEPQ